MRDLKKYPYMSKTEVKLLNEVINQPNLMRSRLIKEWNSDMPHFGGSMPHRYNDKDKYCAYCNRPKNWKPRNVFFNDDGTESRE